MLNRKLERGIEFVVALGYREPLGERAQEAGDQTRLAARRASASCGRSCRTKRQISGLRVAHQVAVEVVDVGQ